MRNTLEDLKLSIDKELDKKSNNLYLMQLRQLGLNRLMKEEIKKINKIEYIYIKTNICFQKELNKVLKEEINKIFTKAIEKDIDILSIKGLILAKQLYKYPEIRKINDIDILINFKDIEDVLYLCKQLGYKINNETEINQEFIDSFNKNYFFDHHLSPLYKEVFINNTKFNICLEIHVYLLPHWMFEISYKDLELTEILIKRSTYSLDLERTVKILNIYDNIIFLSMHFYKHYIFDILLGFKTGEIKNNINLSLLHDIALIIDNNYIEWTNIIKYIKDWKCETELAFVFKFLNYFYPNRIPIKIIEELKLKIRSQKNGFLNKFALFYNEIPINKSFWKDVSILATEIIKESEKTCDSLEIKRKNNADNYEFNFSLKETLNYTDYENEKSVKIQGNLNWNKRNLIIRFKVEKINSDLASILHDEDKFYIYVQSSDINMHQPSCRALYFIPENNENHIILNGNIWINDENNEINRDNFTYNIELCEGGYILELYINWHVIGIDINEKKEFRFDMKFSNKTTIFTWSNIYYPYYDISSYGQITLLE